MHISVSESVIANNSTGVDIQTSEDGHPITLVASRSVIAGNGTGVFASGTGATVRLAESMVTGNQIGWQNNSFENPVTQSYGDNYIDGNGSNETPPPGIPQK